MLISDGGSRFLFSKTAKIILVLCTLVGEARAQRSMPGAGEYTSSGPADYVVLEGLPGEEDPCPGGVCPTGVPIDGGAGWLLAAGAGYGIKKLRERRKKKSEAENQPEAEVV